MKKILLMALLGVAGMSKQAEAQFVTSFGVNLNWGVPQYVTDVVYYDYYDYDWVHANRVVRGGRTFFDVVLQRNNVFVQVSIGRNGHIYNTRYYDYYPLNNHVCGNFCGFHNYYYTTYNRGCNSHHHHGHNHIAYRPRPRTYVYGAYRHQPRYRVAHGNNRHYDRGYQKHNNGKHYGHNKGTNKYNSHSRDQRTSQARGSDSRERYSRLHDQPQRSRSGERQQQVKQRSRSVDQHKRGRSGERGNSKHSSHERGRSGRGTK